ncbi:sialic acid-binding Ig-like lectin 5 [Alligator sinensis]|uniref:Sialic acid-binding Ig-like lectin 5 n=1 Tax=Alligator sinensis TaxID=38654 RepID=A0A3Q0FLM8_ALLSI|nr:sialic acid-binding Ig-like lectin 5 [Alligator sinensis]
MEGSCMTLPCSFSYPQREQVTAVMWKQNDKYFVYHLEEVRVSAVFKDHAHYLGDQQHNCSLRLSGLRLHDQGIYHFRFETTNSNRTEGWTGQPGAVPHSLCPSQCPLHQHCRGTNILCSRTCKVKQPNFLLVSSTDACGTPHLQVDPESLTCSVRDSCPYSPSWYGPDGRLIPEQTQQGNQTRLQRSSSQLPPGTALSCLLDGYKEPCTPDWPPKSDAALTPLSSSAALNKTSVEILQLTQRSLGRDSNSITLHCQGPSREPMTRYIWSRDSKWLLEAGEDLSITHEDVAGDGGYTCGIWMSSLGWGLLVSSGGEPITLHCHSGCFQLSPLLIGAIVVADILIIAFINLGAHYLCRRGQKKTELAKGETMAVDSLYGDVLNCPTLEMEPTYEDIFAPGPNGLMSAVFHRM